jgi:pimeloyl-ACP methyl ester carboxylesterase
VHGIYAGASSNEWRHTVDSLAERYTVFTVDLIGFGRSDRPRLRYTPAFYQAFLGDVMNRLGRGPLAVVATSLSAALVVTVAARDPRHVAALALIEPTGLGQLSGPPTTAQSASQLLLEAPIVGTFIGADQSKSAAENLETFGKLWPPIIRYAGERGIKIAIENCPMLWHDTWPGGQNVAYSPTIWKRMFEMIPDENFGLNYDPSHLIWQFIDEVKPIREFKDRLFHAHAKDMWIDRDKLAQDGILSAGVGWAIPRLPGLGEVRWGDLIAALYEVGYDYVISIEHEDRAFEKTEELVKRGFYLTRDYLSPWIV